MNKFFSILRNKEIMLRVLFMLMVFLIVCIGSTITIPGISLSSRVNEELSKASFLSLMDLFSGGSLRNFSILALGVAPYITSQMIVQLLSYDVLPVLTELSKQGEKGRIEKEFAIRCLTLLIGSVQAYGIIRTLKNRGLITFNVGESFWCYSYVIIVVLAGTMMAIWLGDQITNKGLGNGISMILFAGCVRKIPFLLKGIMENWILSNKNHGSYELTNGIFKFSCFCLFFFLIISFVVFFELSQRKLPVQYSGKNNLNPEEKKVNYLPLKINSAGISPVIFASSILFSPIIISGLITPNEQSWTKLLSYNEFYIIGNTRVPVGLFLYLILIFVFSFFYSNLHISPQKLAENFQKNGSYIYGIRPGAETEKYVAKLLRRITFFGAISLCFVAGLPVVLNLYNVFGGNVKGLSLSGTSIIIIVSSSIEIKEQVNGLLASKTFDDESIKFKLGNINY